MGSTQVSKAIEAASVATVWDLVSATADKAPHAIAVQDQEYGFTYAQLKQRVDMTARFLTQHGLKRGDRLTVLARNCIQYVELQLAAAKLGVILAALNWRLADAELRHCITLVDPKMLICQPGFEAKVQNLNIGNLTVHTLGDQYEAELSRLAGVETVLPDDGRSSEDGLVILYTSGTTGLPKGALVSHRAMIARSMCFTSELSIKHDAGFVAWAPFYHMASMDHSLATLMRGGTVYVVDGYQPDRLIECLETAHIGWFVVMPGMVGEFAALCKKRKVKVKNTVVCGAMADLVPKEDIAAVTKVLGVPYVNTFGATETGLPPATGALIDVGVMPKSLSKRQSAFCEVRLLDPDDNDVPNGEPGEVAVRGPTLFSGYWNADKTNAHDFRNGWFHMGDVMRRNENGTLDYVDRVKYLIKSGGENIYPAEIEQIVLKDARVMEAIVVRAFDKKWGEVPVLFVVRNDATLTTQDLEELCKRGLSNYKRPKDIRFITEKDLPRSTTGKIQRHLLEKLL
jgi:fatty-acyl-CoA synthase